jgi:hypothetical protein
MNIVNDNSAPKRILLVEDNPGDASWHRRRSGTARCAATYTTSKTALRR